MRLKSVQQLAREDGLSFEDGSLPTTLTEFLGLLHAANQESIRRWKRECARDGHPVTERFPRWSGCRCGQVFERHV